MMKIIRRLIRIIAVLIISISILIPPEAYGTRLDSIISMLTNPSDDGIEIMIHAEAVHVPELSETRTEWLNRLLSHIAIILRMNGDIQEETIEVDGMEAIRLTSRNSDSKTDYPGEDRTEYYRRIAVLLPEFYSFFSILPDMYTNETAVAKANVRFKGYGTATKRLSLSVGDDALTSEKMQELLSQNDLKELGDILSMVILSGRQRITLLTDDNGQLMKVNYTGKAGFSQDDMRNVNLDWRCMRSENAYRDELQLTTPRTSGSGKNNISITQEMRDDGDGSRLYSCSAETDQVVDRVRTRYLLSVDLNEKNDHISGVITEKTITGSLSEIVTIVADIECITQDEYHGSLEITRVSGKIMKEQVRLNVVLSACGEIPFDASRTEMLTKDAEKALAEIITGDFLHAMIHVPEQDLQYFLADLPDGLWSELVRQYEMTEEIPVP